MSDPQGPRRSPPGGPGRPDSGGAVLPLEGGRAWRRSPVGRRVLDYLRATDARTLAEQIELTAIPAPPFGEEARAARMAELLAGAGAADVTIDAVGNVLGWWPGRPRGGGLSAPLVVSAHLDTVFPAGTPIEVERRGDLVKAPGIGDDGRGLASVLAIARSCAEFDLAFTRPILFAATVGEEGVGDLRGVRHLFSDEGAARGAAGFVSIDGAGAGRIVTWGLGSWRWRIRASGPGGHSWVDWGTTNPVHLIATIVAGAAALPLPDGVTLSTGRIAGGTSVNSIPQSAWAEVEIRGRRLEPMQEAHRAFLEVIEAARETAAGQRSRGPRPKLVVERIGNRPPGRTDPDATLVRAAVAATEAFGETAEFAISSTDANLPMSLGVPAITIGGGGLAGQAHTREEWYRNVKGPDGIARALLTLVLADAALAPAVAAD